MWEGLESLQGEARPLVLATEIWQRGMATLSFNFSSPQNGHKSWCPGIGGTLTVKCRTDLIPHVFIQAKFHTANVDRRAEWMPRGRGGEGSVMSTVY